MYITYVELEMKTRLTSSQLKINKETGKAEDDLRICYLCPVPYISTYYIPPSLAGMTGPLFSCYVYFLGSLLKDKT